MNRSIAELLKTEIQSSSIAWIDLVCGMIEPLQIKTKKGDGVAVKTIPGYRNPNRAACDINNQYQDCSPATAKKSIIYIEAGECSRQSETIRWQEYKLRLSVTCWLNLKQINSAYTDASDFADELLAAIGSSLPNSAPYNTIRVDYAGTSRDLAAVNKYDYDEPENQSWIYPFDFFVLEFDVTFRRTTACHRTVTLNPSGCKVYS